MKDLDSIYKIIDELLTEDAKRGYSNLEGMIGISRIYVKNAPKSLIFTRLVKKDKDFLNVSITARKKFLFIFSSNISNGFLINKNNILFNPMEDDTNDNFELIRLVEYLNRELSLSENKHINPNDLDYIGQSVDKNKTIKFWKIGKISPPIWATIEYSKIVTYGITSNYPDLVKSNN